MTDLKNWEAITSTSLAIREISQNATDAISITNAQFKALSSFREHTTLPVLSNWHSHIYAEVFKAIGAMTELPSGDPLHLNGDVAEKAIDIIGFLKEQMRIDPPSIINQDGEAVALTWVDGGSPSMPLE